MFLGRKDEPGTVCVAHVVDVDFKYRATLVADKGPVDYVIKGICEMRRDIGRKRIIIRTDGEPAVTKLAEAVAAFRAEETALEMTSKDNSQGIGPVERGNYLVASCARALRSTIEEKLGWRIPIGHPIVSWLIRHCSWLLNRYSVGHDGKTPYERAKGRAYKGELCELFEVVLWRDIDKAEHKFEARFNVGVWLGKATRSGDHLIFDNEVHRCRAVQRRTNLRR
jgi:hypothetical protein